MVKRGGGHVALFREVGGVGGGGSSTKPWGIPGKKRLNLVVTMKHTSLHPFSLSFIMSEGEEEFDPCAF